MIAGVRWDDSIRRMIADGFDTFYEVGPGRVLTGLLKRIDRKIPVHERPGSVTAGLPTASFTPFSQRMPLGLESWRISDVKAKVPKGSRWICPGKLPSSPARRAGSGGRSPSTWRAAAQPSPALPGRSGRFDATLAAIREAGGTAEGFAANVGDPADVARVLEEIEAKFPKIQILVNNAGVTRDGLMLRMEDDAWDEVIDVNLKGTFLFCRALGAIMMRQRYGRMINITSISGINGNPGQANYSASKAGVIGFTKTIAKELASRGITVNAVAPGLHHDRHDERPPRQDQGRGQGSASRSAAWASPRTSPTWWPTWPAPRPAT